jgi:hypothetical protein
LPSLGEHGHTRRWLFTDANSDSDARAYANSNAARLADAHANAFTDAYTNIRFLLGRVRPDAQEHLVCRFN